MCHTLVLARIPPGVAIIYFQYPFFPVITHEVASTSGSLSHFFFVIHDLGTRFDFDLECWMRVPSFCIVRLLLSRYINNILTKQGKKNDSKQVPSLYKGDHSC